MRRDTIGIGEILVDMVPAEEGEYFEGIPFEAHLGGAPFNYAIDFSHLGGSSGGIGAVGKDPFGDMLIRFLSSHGVSVSGIVRKEFLTSLAFVTLRGGERSFFFYRKPKAVTADTELSPEDLKEEEIEGAEILHVSGMALSCPPLREAVHRAIEIARESGRIISFDLNVRPSVWASKEEMLREYEKAMSESDVISLSVEDMEFLFPGVELEEVASKLSSRYGAYLVGIKLGSRGSYVLCRGEGKLIPSFKVKAVDTTGAGDAWIAALNFYHFIRGEDVFEAAKLANAAGALTCTKRGAVRGFSSSEEVERLASSELEGPSR